MLPGWAWAWTGVRVGSAPEHGAVVRDLRFRDAEGRPGCQDRLGLDVLPR